MTRVSKSVLYILQYIVSKRILYSLYSIKKCLLDSLSSLSEVNFDLKCAMLFKECRNLQAMGHRLPYGVKVRTASLRSPFGPVSI